MEFGTIEREIHIDASPEVVFEVVSSPEHLRGWWPDEARYEAVPGSAGEVVFGDPADGGHVASFTVVDVRPPRSFSFRWTHPAGEAADEHNSLLVTFELTPSGSGTRLTMTETGFRERGWEVAVLEEQYRDHVAGWDHFLPRLAPYVATLAGQPALP
ncbi:SRPBCC family protein [Modestobacter versicolor]|uniref:SRPBCC family protein n=1 Tax=Modestobacter versicolor TaxID=429133 RepID=UPI0034DED04A